MRLKVQCGRTQLGFTYMGLLILLAILGIGLAAGIQAGRAMQRRSAEQALLHIGGEFADALDSYRRATPAGASDEPATLDELLRDPRYPGVVRHLRKRYADPLTGRAEWGLVRAEDTKRIVGIHSLADGQPIKVGNFPARFRGLDAKTSYREWIFTSLQSFAANSGARSKTVSPGEMRDDYFDSLPMEKAKPSAPAGLSGSNLGSSSQAGASAPAPGAANTHAEVASGNAPTGSAATSAGSSSDAPGPAPIADQTAPASISAIPPTGSVGRPALVSPGAARDD